MTFTERAIGNRTMLLLLTAALAAGCGSGPQLDEGGVAAEQPEVVLATAVVGDSHTISFVEVSPGVTIVREDMSEPGDARLERFGPSDASLPLSEQFARLTGTATIQPAIRAALDAADERRVALQARIRSGELAAPPRQAPRAPLVPQFADSDYEWDWENNTATATEYYNMDCPSPSPFSHEWCGDLPSGTWSTGWNGDTSFFRSSTFKDIGTIFYLHIVQRWNGSAWVNVLDQPVGYNVSGQVYSMYVTDFPWMQSTFIVHETLSGRPLGHAAVVWNMQ